MRIIADLQLHSKYSRAVSKDMELPFIWEWGNKKGIDLVATGDWTHPLWLLEIKQNLEELGNGLLRLKGADDGPKFLLATEISSIYSQDSKLRRIHNLIWAPSLSTVAKINQELIRHGANLGSDGRPIVGLSSINLADLVFSVDANCLLIPAHAWTPWFSLYGSNSGFDSIDECFGKFSQYIYAIETGLSSDPAMNWRIKELDNRSIVSFSDAHSGPKLGREATVFDLGDLSYSHIRQAILSSSPANRIAFTIEFFPEEGKYHYTGHRACGVVQSPEETAKNGTTCHVCGRPLTVGVMHRVEELAGRSEEDLKIVKKNLSGTKLDAVYSQAFPKRAPYVMLVPLQEILAESLGALPGSQKVQDEYQKLTDNFAGEFKVLLETSLEDIAKIAGVKTAQAIDKVRRADLSIDPGYDGVFGKINLWPKTETLKPSDSQTQLGLFS